MLTATQRPTFRKLVHTPSFTTDIAFVRCSLTNACERASHFRQVVGVNIFLLVEGAAIDWTRTPL
jgi:hypothetical protein